MVALDTTASLETQKVPFHLPKISVAGWMGLTALAVAFGSVAASGFSDNGLTLAGENAWRFAMFAFFAAITAGPLGRLVPGLQRLADQSRFFGWGFCASYGVYLVAVLMPDAFGMASMMHRPSAATTLFVLFGAGVTLVMALALTPRMAERAGEPVQRALLGIAVVYFWLCYAMMGLSHLSHPHRPDGFYGLSLSFMLLALLLRFADSCATNLRRRAIHSTQA